MVCFITYLFYPLEKEPSVLIGWGKVEPSGSAEIVAKIKISCAHVGNQTG
jgi:hypothetical protein